jgi:hypothetical protein
MTATGIHLTDLAVALGGAARDLRFHAKACRPDPQGDTMSVHVRFSDGGTAYVSASLAMPLVSRFALWPGEAGSKFATRRMSKRRPVGRHLCYSRARSPLRKFHRPNPSRTISLHSPVPFVAKRLIPSAGKTSSTTSPFLKPPSNRPPETARW